MSIMVDLAPETERALRAAAEAEGRDVSEVVRTLVEKAYPPERRFPSPGFAAHMRRDDLPPEEIVKQLRSDWDEAA